MITGNEEFKKKMLEKYSRENVMGTGIPQPAQPYLPHGNPRTGYTGDVPPSQPAGIVHGKEQVIEEPMVKAAGGPEKIRETVENMAGEAAQQRIPGFQSGTGSGVVPEKKKTVQTQTIAKKDPESIEIEKPRGAISRTTTITPKGNVTRFDTRPGTTDEGQRAQALAANTSAQNSLAATTEAATGQPSARVPQPAATEPQLAPPPPAPAPAPKPTDVETGLKGIRGVAAGRSEAQRILQDQAEQRQAGTAAVEDMSLAQQQAVSGTDEGAAAADRANLRRQQGIRETSENVALAQQAAERQETAQKALFSAGMDVAKFNEMKRQFGENLDFSKEQFGLSKEQFEQVKKQFDSDDAFRKFSYENMSAAQKEAFRLQGESNEQAKERWVYDKQTDAINAATQAGDFDEVERLWGERNVNFDATKLRDSAAQAEFGTALGNVETSIAAGNLDQFRAEDGSFDYTKATNDPEFKSQLERAGKQIGLEPGTKEYKEWAENTLEARQLSRDPYYSAAQALSNDTINNMMTNAGWDEGEFEYAGKTGPAGARLAITAMFASKALGLDSGGDATLTDNSTSNNIFSKQKTPEEKAEAAANPTLTGDVTVDAPRLVDAAVTTNDPAKLNDIKPGHWDTILSDPNMMEKIRPMVPEVTSKTQFHTVGDVLDSDLKFDTVERRKYSRERKDEDETSQLEYGAGDGKGSVVFYNGEPYRLTRFQAVEEVRDKTDDLQGGIIYAKPISGGEEIEISNSPFKEKETGPSESEETVKKAARVGSNVLRPGAAVAGAAAKGIKGLFK